MTSQTDSSRDPVELLAESFQERLRRGERPSLEEYAARCPARADEIRALFPALVELEQLRPGGSLAGGIDVPPAVPPVARITRHPERLGDYHILRVVGEGGMGVVYEAEHDSLKNLVALKVMHPRFRADAAHLRRFHTEARSAARLHHTNIVPVFDYGEQDGICFYAMPLIDGVGLDKVLEDVRRLRMVDGNAAPSSDLQASEAATRSGAGTLRAVSLGVRTGRFATDPVAVEEPDSPPTAFPAGEEGEATQCAGVAGAVDRAPPDRASQTPSSSMAGQSEPVYERELARLARQVADALEYAHRQGVVHRDIKPSNLLLDARGNVWVTDFGLAKLVEGDDLSQSHELVGTVRFMAPERFRGVTDRRADIYAVGATLYELLTLRPAFAERDPIRLIAQITHETPAPPREHNRRIPRDLETIVVKALAKDPKDRFATAGELRDELGRFLEGRPIRSRPVGLVEQFWRWCKRNPGLAGANIAAALLTTILAVGSTIAAWSYREQLEQTRMAQRRGRLELGKSLQTEGAALQRSGLMGQRFESLARLTQAAEVLREHPDGSERLPDLRDQAITAMGLTDLKVRSEREIGPVMTVCCDRRLERYAVVESLNKPSVGGQAVVRRLDDDRELFRAPNPGLEFWYATPSFSPDGQYLAISYLQSDASVLMDVWHLGRRERVCHQAARSSGRVFLPDGLRFVLAPPGKDLAVWDLAANRETSRLPLDFVPEALCIDSAGKRIAANEANSRTPRLRVLDVDEGKLLTHWTEGVGSGAMSWSSDDRLLAVGHSDGRIFVWDMKRGQLASVFKGRPLTVVRCLFAPGSHLLATSTWDPTTLLWNAATGEPLVSAWSNGSFLEFDDTGRGLAFFDGTRLGVWEVAQGEEMTVLCPGMVGNRTNAYGNEGHNEACFSPDGRMAAVSTRSATHLYDGRTGRELAQLETGRVETVLFDQAGRNLITCGERGLLRLPIKPEATGTAGAVEIGPPSLIRELGADNWFKACWLPGGRSLAATDHARLRVLLVDANDPGSYRKRVPFLSPPPRFRLTSIAVSPDGRWAAAGGWKEPAIHIWNLPLRKLERSLPPADRLEDPCALVMFSPDGRWLVSCTNATGASGYYFWEVGTWRRGPFLPKSDSAGWDEPLFSPDGRILAACLSPHQIRLYDMTTGRTLAHLTTLQPLSSAPLAFSADGTRLIAVTNQCTALLWNLRRIRERLRAMDLDWDQPPYPPEQASAGADRPSIPAISVIGEALAYGTRHELERKAVDLRLHDHPNDGDALVERGWLKLQMNQAAAAIADLRQAVGLRPRDGDAWFLLAQAHNQTNNAEETRRALDQYLSLSSDDVEARISKAQIALRLGRFQEALDDSTRVLDADPERDVARLCRAEACVALRRFQEALTDLDPLAGRFPGDPVVMDLRSQANEHLGNHAQAKADMAQAAESPLADAKSLNNLAWRMATGPSALRDPQRALAYARKAVERERGSAMYLNTLGVAEYRAGHFPQAITTLEKSLKASQGQSDGFDLFFLAMARFNLGQTGPALEHYTRAVAWVREHPHLPQPWAGELKAFKAEAEQLLNAALPSLPADPFAPCEAAPTCRGRTQRDGLPGTTRTLDVSPPGPSPSANQGMP